VRSVCSACNDRFVFEFSFHFTSFMEKRNPNHASLNSVHYRNDECVDRDMLVDYATSRGENDEKNLCRSLDATRSYHLSW